MDDSRTDNSGPSNVYNPVIKQRFISNVLSLSSRVSHITNLTRNTTAAAKSNENRATQTRELFPATRQYYEENHCQPSKKRAHKRPKRNRKEKDEFKQKKFLQRRFRRIAELSESSNERNDNLHPALINWLYQYSIGVYVVCDHDVLVSLRRVVWKSTSKISISYAFASCVQKDTYYFICFVIRCWRSWKCFIIVH